MKKSKSHVHVAHVYVHSYVNVRLSAWDREWEKEMVDLSLHGKKRQMRKKKTMTNLQSPPYDYLNHNVTAFEKVDRKTYYQFYWQIKSIQNRFWYLRLFYGVFKSTCFSMLATSRTLVKLQKFWNILLQVKLQDL